MNPTKFKAIIFDLFGTVVHFAPHAPSGGAAGPLWRPAMDWLRSAAQDAAPELAFDDLPAALLAVSEEINRGRPPEYLEVPSRERFRRALARAGVEETAATELAATLSTAHMQFLADQTRLPRGHVEILERLSRDYRLALISNFDHGPTARAVLERHGVSAYFDPIVISDGFGRRKPHPAIFRATLDRMKLSEEEAVYVGDSLSDDVVGARNAGMAVVWINPKRKEVPPGLPKADREIAELAEVAAALRS